MNDITATFSIKERLCIFHFFSRDEFGMDKAEALTRTAKGSGISRTSIFCFLKQKLHAKRLQDNRCKYRNTMTAFERLSLEDTDKIRFLIHDEFRKFRKTKGEGRKKKDEPKIEAQYPSYGTIHFFYKIVRAHCSKSLIFVHKLNIDKTLL